MVLDMAGDDFFKWKYAYEWCELRNMVLLLPLMSQTASDECFPRNFMIFDHVDRK